MSSDDLSKPYFPSFFTVFNEKKVLENARIMMMAARHNSMQETIVIDSIPKVDEVTQIPNPRQAPPCTFLPSITSFYTMATKPLNHDKVMAAQYLRKGFLWSRDVHTDIRRGTMYGKTMAARALFPYHKFSYLSETTGNVVEVEAYMPIEPFSKQLVFLESKTKRAKNRETAMAPRTMIYMINGGTEIDTWQLELFRRSNDKHWRQFIREAIKNRCHYPLSGFYEWLKADLQLRSYNYSPEPVRFADQNHMHKAPLSPAEYQRMMMVKLPEAVLLPRQNGKWQKTMARLNQLFHTNGLREMYYTEQQEYLAQHFWSGPQYRGRFDVY